MKTREELDAAAADGCHCCGRTLDPTLLAWLELSVRTGRWYLPGACPADESQGLFAFGKVCARRALRKQRRLP